ncbi:molecular chaperone DnaJ (plasmid) [Escherichia coli]|uniref:molecular chaperone DnaJ n=1 Tax=Escherichia coli TaxID=562 RepID=UPI002ACBFE64|nr:molecular chaperone DnaJ [Escherichia coli]WQB90950.1 molecular chaperone DnaJ [Escherichia coli]
MHCARSSLTLTRAVAPRHAAMHLGNSLALALTAAFCGANQHNHGLLVSWALQGEGMACAPWHGRLRRASGAMWLLCCPGIFVRLFHPLTRIKNVTSLIE